MLRGRIISDGQRFEKIVPLSATRNSQCNAECERPERRCPSSTPSFRWPPTSTASRRRRRSLNNDCDCGDRLPRYRCLMTARIDYNVYRGPTELCSWRLCLAPGCRRTYSVKTGFFLLTRTL